ncbi:DUF3298 domain-containing protein [Fibrisoma montanum]|uniref:DUF3298 domain-containing protein n=1 Tax=Fibrisoma montanum TaxID=2305895 RepID=A0A418MH45_9BACT|nr:DUF3298 and DUF4163 domain-containing protein [Fibrisoma montanum]RIV26750.1 DUF3298 domain-containing protein [Fibrisoma montanum]
MRYFLWAFFLCSSIYWTACHSVTNPNPPVLEPQRYNFTGESKCDTATRRGITVSVSYFQLRDESDAGRVINAALRDLAAKSITSWLDSATVAQHPDAQTDLNKAATLLAASYDSMANDIGALGGCWELQTKGDTLHANSKILSVKLSAYAYTGGAHPNSSTSLYTFDRTTGKPLSLTDLVTDTTALLGIVEKAFRKHQDLLPQYNLEERGYFLRDGKFFLPANVALARDGLLFYYNPYEIAAYAVGPIEVTVPYSQLQTVLNDDWQAD